MSVATAQIVLLGSIFVVVIGFLLLLLVFGTNAVSQMTGITDQLVNAFGVVFDAFLSTTQFLVNSLTQFASLLARTFRSFVLKVTNGFNSINEFLSQQLTGIIRGVSTIIIRLGSQIGRYVFQTFFNVTFGAQSLSNAYTSMQNSITAELSSLIASAITLIFDLISQGITSAVDIVTFSITTIIDVIATGFSAAITGAVIAIDNLVSGINYFTDTILPEAFAQGEALINQIKMAIDDLVNFILNTIPETYNNLACASCCWCHSANVTVNVPGFSIPTFPGFPDIDIPGWSFGIGLNTFGVCPVICLGKNCGDCGCPTCS